MTNPLPRLRHLLHTRTSAIGTVPCAMKTDSATSTYRGESLCAEAKYTASGNRRPRRSSNIAQCAGCHRNVSGSANANWNRKLWPLCPTQLRKLRLLQGKRSCPIWQNVHPIERQFYSTKKQAMARQLQNVGFCQHLFVQP